MLTRNGSGVTAIAKSSAGSSGSRRRHGEENGSPTLPFSVASAVLTAELLDRLRRDLLTLPQCRGVLHRAGDHAREELGTTVADILELRDADVLHTRKPGTLRRARIVDRCCLHRRQRLPGERRRGPLVLRDLISREARSRRNRRPAALGLRAGGLDVVGPGRPGD